MIEKRGLERGNPCVEFHSVPDDLLYRNEAALLSERTDMVQIQLRAEFELRSC